MSSNRRTIAPTGQARAGLHAPRALHPETIGDLLLRYRVAVGLTQKELAERATLSVRAIGDIERGVKQHPHRETIRLLADTLTLSDEQRDCFLAAARQQRTPAPTLAPVVSVPSNLPAQVTPLIGRADAMRSASAMLRGGHARLLTITGTGGVGKTRLAIAVADDMRANTLDGVVFVPLAAVRSAALVPAAIAQALGVRERSGYSLRGMIFDTIGQKRLLLVLDNFEHLSSAASLVGDALAACPQLIVLATSRTPLHVYGEHLFLVPPLALPDTSQTSDTAALARVAAVELFIQRAQAARPDFRLTADTAATISAICHRLDGLPLALELAAARIRHLSPTTLLARLERRLHVLTAGPTDRPERQQTMRAAIAWSHDLLSQEEQRLFRRLAVFVGGVTLEAVEAIFSEPGDASASIRTDVESLVDKQLVRAEEDAGAVRLTMLETIREYALEQMAANGETEAMLRRHTAYFLTFAEAAEPALIGPVHKPILARLEVDHENLRAALQWARDAAEPGIGLRLAAALWPFWNVHSYLREGREWLEIFLARTVGNDQPGDATTRAKALSGAAMLAHQQGDVTQSAAYAEECLTLYRQWEDKRGIAFALNLLGAAAFEHNDYERATARYTESLALRREIRDHWGIAGSLNNLGRTARFQGDFARAAAFYEESEALRREIGDKLGVAIALGNRGHMARDQGDHVRAGPLLEESLLLYQEMQDKRGIAIVLNQLAQLAHDVGDTQRARMLCEESLALRQDIGDKWGIANSLSTLGEIAYAAGDHARAQTLYQASLARYASMHNVLGIVECLERLARPMARQEEWEEVARLLGAVAALREHIRVPILPIDQPVIEQIIVAARAVCSDDLFTATWKAGHRAPLEQIIADAVGKDAGIPS